MKKTTLAIMHTTTLLAAFQANRVSRVYYYIVHCTVISAHKNN